MPLFFISTVYLFKYKYLYNHKSYFCNKINKQYDATYIKWCIVFLLLHNIFILPSIKNLSSPQTKFINIYRSKELKGFYFFKY